MPWLKVVELNCNSELNDLSPLSACTAIELLLIDNCPLITSLAPLSALLNLKELCCNFIDPQTSILPLASCTGLKRLYCDFDAVDLKELRRRRLDLKIKLSIK